jgi:hypothetical protein
MLWLRFFTMYSKIAFFKKLGDSNESNFSGVGTAPVRHRKPAARERGHL